MNNLLNIADILMKMPKGTKLYSPIFGNCALVRVKKGVYDSYDEVIEVFAQFTAQGTYTFDFAGRYAANNNRLGECLLFPSKENRDWVEFARNNTKKLVVNARN
jgi:hypothetical protein